MRRMSCLASIESSNLFSDCLSKEKEGEAKVGDSNTEQFDYVTVGGGGGTQHEEKIDHAKYTL
jgi:NAD kinase